MLRGGDLPKGKINEKKPSATNAMARARIGHIDLK
jgi:hypothetical protein